MSYFRLNSGWRPLLLLVIFIATAISARAEQSTDWQYQITEAPEWIEPITRSDEPNDSQNALQVLIFDRQVRYTPDNELSRYFHLRQRINNSTALESAGRIEVVIQPDYEQLDLHSITLIRDNERQQLLNQDAIEILRQEGELASSIYQGSLTVMQILEGLQVGDMIEYRYTIHGHNPVLGNRYSDAWQMGWQLDVDFARLRLQVPDQREFIVRAHDSLKESRQRQLGELRQYEWTVSDYRGHFRPDDMPDWHFAYPMVEITEYKNWHEVAAWGADLFEQALSEPVQWPESEIIIANSELSPLQKASQLLNLVQEKIRYFGIETGVNALRPSQPTETINRLYGDCKDKSVVLTRLLNNAGIKADSVLVSARRQRGIAQRLPGTHVFDHAIVMMEIDDQRYWLDPTATHQGDDLQTIGFIDYGYALPLSADTSDLMPVLQPPGAGSQIHIDQAFKGSAENLTLSIKRELNGRIAEQTRRQIDSVGTNEWDQSINDYYHRLYPGLRPVTASEHRDNLQLNRYQTQQDYRIEDPLKLTGTYWKLETFADNIHDYTNLPTRLNREEPLAWSHPVIINQHISVEHEQGLPTHDYEAIEINSPAFQYSRTVTEEDNRLSIHHQYRSLADQIAVDELSGHFENLRQVNEALTVYAFINSPEEERLNQRNENLKNKLRNLLKKD